MGEGNQIEIEDDISFDIPSDIKTARKRKADLQDHVEAIQYQLSQKNRTDDEGNRLPPKKYHKWRRHALKALTAKKRELRFLKKWIRDWQKERSSKKFDVDPDDPEELLVAANNLIQEKIGEGCEFTDDELILANTIRDHVLGLL